PGHHQYLEESRWYQARCCKRHQWSSLTLRHPLLLHLGDQAISRTRYVLSLHLLDTWANRCPDRWFFFMSVMRNAFVIIVLTLASFLYSRKRLDPETGKYPIRILLTVPSGFKH